MPSDNNEFWHTFWMTNWMYQSHVDCKQDQKIQRLEDRSVLNIACKLGDIPSVPLWFDADQRRLVYSSPFLRELKLLLLLRDLQRLGDITPSNIEANIEACRQHLEKLIATEKPPPPYNRLKDILWMCVMGACLVLAALISFCIFTPSH